MAASTDLPVACIVNIFNSFAAENAAISIDFALHGRAMLANYFAVISPAFCAFLDSRRLMIVLEMIWNTLESTQ